MDLGLDTVRTSGRAAHPILAEVVRELTSADLALLETERGIKPPTLKKLRDSHHAIARLIAEGKPNTEIQLITGYSASRISILKGDPAFQDLVAFYKPQIEAIRETAFSDTQAKLGALTSDVIDEISDRLNEAPETIPMDELIDLAKLGADRSGFGPSSKSTNVNVNLDLAARISAGRARVARMIGPTSASPALPGPTSAPIEGEVVESTPAPPPSIEGGGE